MPTAIWLGGPSNSKTTKRSLASERHSGAQCALNFPSWALTDIGGNSNHGTKLRSANLYAINKSELMSTRNTTTQWLRLMYLVDLTKSVGLDFAQLTSDILCIDCAAKIFNTVASKPPRLRRK